MQAAAQVIQRNTTQFSDYNRVLVFGQPESETLSFLEYKQAVTFDYRVFNSLKGTLEERVAFTCNRVSDDPFDCAIVFLPKAKEELELVLAFLTPQLEKGASIYLVGEKKAGIASASKKLAKYGSNLSKIDSAKHCQLWHVSIDQAPAAFKLNDWISTYPVEVAGQQLNVVTIPGVFSYGRLDDGTQMLLNNLPKNINGRLLDFGCGSGVIGAFAAKAYPDVSVEMVDINLLAIKCAQATLDQNKLKGDVYPSDGLSDVRGRVNAILTNPPFHSGVRTEYTTTESFIRSALDKMTKHAPMVLVANSFLKYSPIMEQSFGSYVVLEENTKFRVYQVRR